MSANEQDPSDALMSPETGNVLTRDVWPFAVTYK
ncbi:hypothetical protein ABIB57_004392 [Devosia sp. UYZn731]